MTNQNRISSAGERFADRVRYRVTATDGRSPIEAELRDREGALPPVRLTPPLIREWVGSELGDGRYPFPGGATRLDRMIEIPADGNPGELVVRDFAGNLATRLLASAD